MSQNSEYKNIKELISAISSSIHELESGKMNQEKLELLLDDSRNLHERIAILHYLAFEKEVKEKVSPIKKKTKTEAQGSYQLNFGISQVKDETKKEEDRYIHPNQINLIDAIEEQFEDEDAVIEKQKVPHNNEKKSSAKVQEDTPKSINDKFAGQAETKTLAQKHIGKPISKLKEAIALNEKFLFMNDLFEGENSHYNDAIDKLDSLSSFEDAETHFNLLATQYDWDRESKPVNKFYSLIERRFM